MDQQKPRKPEKNKGLQTAARLSGIGLQMGLTIYIGNLLGAWLDTKYSTTFLENTCTLLAIFLALYSVIRQANRINN